MSARTWMYDTKAIHNSFLRNICLPASHDSGANHLSDVMAPASGALAILKWVDGIAKKLKAVPFINKVINPAQWVMSKAVPAMDGLSTATNRTIAQQLNDGIRCLDLRICYVKADKQSPFYVYHGLLGAKLSDVLQQIQKFLKSTKGEIVYVTMGHWEHFGEGKTRASLIKKVDTMVSQSLGTYAYAPKHSKGKITNNPFNQTYSDIIGQGGTSKVILVSSASAGKNFWPRDFSPPDNNKGRSKILCGYYTCTTDLNNMLTTQQTQQKGTTAGLPFALYMTLTPSEADGEIIVGASMSYALWRLAGTLSAIPVIGGALAAALNAIAIGLGIAKPNFSWRTLAELNLQISSKFLELFNQYFAKPGQQNVISFFYVDFYETVPVVELAVSLSLANASAALPRLPVVPVYEWQTNKDNTGPIWAPAPGQSGWWNIGEVWRAYSEQAGKAVPIYCYTANGSFYLSTDDEAPTGWQPASPSITFYAFAKPGPGLAPVYQYTNLDGSPPYFYTTMPGWGEGWGYSAGVVVFYVLPQSFTPVYLFASNSSGQDRFYYSASSQTPAGWTPRGVAFRQAAPQSGASFTEFVWSQTNSYGSNFMLARSQPAPPNWTNTEQGFWVFGASAVGLVGFRQFTKSDPQFTTIYYYSPETEIDGWTAGAIVFYAEVAGPPVAASSDAVQVSDLYGLVASGQA